MRIVVDANILTHPEIVLMKLSGSSPVWLSALIGAAIFSILLKVFSLCSPFSFPFFLIFHLSLPDFKKV